MLASRRAHNAQRVNWLSTGDQGKVKSFDFIRLRSKSSQALISTTEAFGSTYSSRSATIGSTRMGTL